MRSDVYTTNMLRYYELSLAGPSGSIDSIDATTSSKRHSHHTEKHRYDKDIVAQKDRITHENPHSPPKRVWIVRIQEKEGDE